MLLYAKVSEPDILLREELGALERAHPQTLRVVHTLDKPTQGWTGASGFDSHELIKMHVPPAELGEKVKVFVCGASLSLSLPCLFFFALCCVLTNDFCAL